MPIARAIHLTLLLFSTMQTQSIVHIETSSAIDYARMIARDEGYEVSRTSLYTFDLLTGSDGKPFHPGFTAIGFFVDVRPANLILVSNVTGQAIDFNTCEVFDYPDLKPFQEQILRITKATRKTPQELADEIGCSPPKVLKRPVSPKRE